MFEVMILGGALLIWWVIDVIQRRRRERPAPFWEAPPFPLENADRIYNWEQRVRAIQMGMVYPPHVSDKAVQKIMNIRAKYGAR